jgi:metal-sulfur cluster biosynthetic enzyme
MIDVETVKGVLNGIVDPCSATAGVPAGLVDMGLVSDISVEPVSDISVEPVSPGRFEVVVSIGVTEVGCFMIGPFASEARARLEALPGDATVTVRLKSAKDWTPEDMSPDLQSRLEAHRKAARQVLLRDGRNTAKGEHGLARR